MDALLTGMLAVLLAETGGRTQLLAALCAIRFDREGRVIAGLLCAILLNVAISAWLGSFIHAAISEDALMFFYALACLFAGLMMLAPHRRVEEPEQGLGAFFGTFVALFLSMLGDKSQFLIGATAARTDMPLWAGIGGFLGLAVACIPAVIFRNQLARALPLVWVRRVGGGLFTVLGVILSLAALGLI